MSLRAGLVITGNGTNTVRLLGSQSLINSALPSLQYAPVTNYAGPDSLVITANDNGNTGSGGQRVAQTSVPMTVSEVNDAPTAVADTPAPIKEDSGPAVFDVLANDSVGPASEVAVGQVLSISGLDTADAHGSVVPTEIGGKWKIVYTPDKDYAGPASFRYRVRDTGSPALDSSYVEVSFTVLPINDTPSFTPGGDVTVNEDENKTIQWATNVSAGPGEAGQTLAFLVTNDNQGLFTVQPVIDASGKLTYTLKDNAFGEANITVQLKDDGGTANGSKDITDPITFKLKVVSQNDAPVAKADILPNIAEGGKLVFPSSDLTANDSDVENDTPLKVTAVNATANTHGTVVLGTDGKITYTPEANYYGPASFTYVVEDPLHANSQPGTVSITIDGVDDDAPTAKADAKTIDEDAAATAIDVLSNDVPDFSETVKITGVTQGTKGQVIITGNGTGLTYKPALNSSGTDTFTYTITDTKNRTATATVTVTVTPVNDAPVAVDDNITLAEDNGRIELPVLANDFNPDASEQETLSILDNTGAAHGTVELVAGKIYYTPALNFSGTDTFTYRITDGNNGTATATVTVTVTPVIDSDAVTVDENSTDNMLDVLANDGNADMGWNPVVIQVRGVNYAVDMEPVATLLGKVRIAANGTGLIYTPDTGKYGTDTFTYTIDPGHGQPPATETVTVIVNRLPVASADIVSKSAHFGAINVLANDTDPGDTLTIASVTQGAKGAVAIAGTKLSYTPGSGFLGTDSFTYTIRDSHGATSTATVTIAITKANDDNLSVDEDSGLNALPVLANDSKAGDATSLTIDAVTTASHGTVSISADGKTLLYTPNANYAGADSFQYTVKDSNGGTATGKVSLVVNDVNENPIALDESITVAEDSGATTINVLTNDLDTDGGTLSIFDKSNGAHGTVSIAADGKSLSYTPDGNFNGTDAFTYRISDGQGGTATATVTVTVTAVNDDPQTKADSFTVQEDSGANSLLVLANDPNPDAGETYKITSATDGAHGKVKVADDFKSLTYTPDANFAGNDTFTYTIVDGTLGGNAVTGTVTVTVQNVNDAPVAKDDAKSTAEDTDLVFPAADLAGNDTDVDGDTLTVASVTTTGAGAPSHGTVSLDGTTKKITYRPASNYNGPDSFTYTISDGKGGTATAKVNVTVTAVNDNPKANADSKTLAEDAPATAIDVLANDSIAPDVNETLSISAKTDGAHGKVKIADDGKSLTYTPDPNYNGNDTFTYTISDGNGGTSTATVSVTVTPVNDDPIAVNDLADVSEDTSKSIDVLKNDKEANPDQGEVLTISAVTQPAHGTTSIVDGKVSYTPVANYFGPDSFKYTITDSAGKTTEATVNVTVLNVNDLPTAVADTATMAEDAGATSIDVLKNDGIAPDVDETLSISAKTDGTHGKVAVTDGGKGLTYTPDANYFGADSFTYTISDGHGGTATATVSVTVTSANDNPNAVTDTASVNEDSVGNQIDVLKNDTIVPDAGEVLSLTGVGEALHGSVELKDGKVLYTPAKDYFGADSFTYTISDGNGGTATGTVSVTVKNVNDLPVLSAIAAQSIDEGQSVSFSASASDVDGDTLSYSLVAAPAGASIDPASGVFNWTPSGTQSGSFEFWVLVSDNGTPALSAVQPVSITVKNIAPAVDAGPDATVAVGGSFSQSGSFADPGTESWTASVDYDWHAGDSDGVALALAGKSFALSHVYSQAGVYTVAVTVSDGLASATDYLTVNVVESGLRVLGLTPNASGFDIRFNREVNSGLLNLYDGLDLASDLSDLTVVGQQSGAIAGSLIWDAANNTAHFIKSGGVLAADQYSVTLASRPDGWVSGTGELLDGDADGNAGGDYQSSFTVAASSARVLSLPDFARGPSQAVVVPATDFGLPIRIDNAADIQSVDLEVLYDPNLLSISGANLAGGMPGGWTITSNLATPGRVIISLSGTTALPAGARELVSLVASIPDSASYGVSQVIQLANIRINEGGGIAGRGDSALAAVAYLGDATGNRAYSGMDSAAISNVVVHNTSGFDAYALTDPVIIADATGNGNLSGLDAAYVAQKSVGQTVPSIPDLPVASLAAAAAAPLAQPAAAASQPVSAAVAAADPVSAPLGIAAPVAAAVARPAPAPAVAWPNRPARKAKLAKTAKPVFATTPIRSVSQRPASSTVTGRLVVRQERLFGAKSIRSRVFE